MKHKPNLTMEVLMAGLLLFCALLLGFLAAGLPGYWALLPLVLWLAMVAALAVWGAALQSALTRWLTGTVFDNSKLKFSLSSLSAPAMLLSGKTILWYNDAFRAQLHCGSEYLLHAAPKLLPGLSLSVSGSPEGQLLHLEDQVLHAWTSTVPGHNENISIVVFSDETALRAAARKYEVCRPGCILFAVDGYTDVFGDMLDSEKAGLLESLYKVLEDTVAGSGGFLQRLSGGVSLAVVEECFLDRLAQSRYAVLDQIRAIAPERSLSLSIGVGRGAENLAQAREMAQQALDMACIMVCRRWLSWWLRVSCR